MLELRYNPFGKRIDALASADLASLRTAAEGWYLEYKGEAIPQKQCAKALCSFANQYGGWLVVGVEENADGFRTAGEFKGIPVQDVPAFEERLRNAARDSANPDIYYRHVVLHGPCEEIGLQQGRAVIVVCVPPGADTPYIHMDGRIYRRVADSSSPRPETDRHLLDGLWERGERARKRLEDVVLSTPVISKGESDTAYLHIYIAHDPMERSGTRFASFDRFRDAMRDKTLPFDNIFPRSGGFVARQTVGNDASSRVLTWEFFDSGYSKITYPFSWARAEHAPAWLDGYENAAAFCGRLGPEYHHCRVLDVNMLFTFLAAVCRRHRALVSEFGISGPFYSKMFLENVWRCIPFVDLESYVTALAEYGVPVMQDDEVLVPPGTNVATMVELEACIIAPDQMYDIFGPKDIQDAVALSLPAFNALGLVPDVLNEGGAELALLPARAREVAAARMRAAT